MKKIMAFFLAVCILYTSAIGQTIRPVRQSALGISFILNDFKTPDRIKTTSLTQVLRDKKWAKFREMSPGLAVTYYKGIKPKIDFSSTLALSFVDYPFRNRAPFGSDNLLAELDASANFKLVDESYWFIPYLTAGVGAHVYRVYYGAFVPVGVGFRLNLFD